MGILRILRDSAGSLVDSRGFFGFLEKVYEVSEVSNPSTIIVKDNLEQNQKIGNRRPGTCNIIMICIC